MVYGSVEMESVRRLVTKKKLPLRMLVVENRKLQNEKEEPKPDVDTAVSAKVPANSMEEKQICGVTLAGEGKLMERPEKLLAK